MAGMSSYPGGNVGFGMMTNVITHFSCGHSETCTVPFTPATSACGMMKSDLPCTLLKCQKKFSNKLKSELQLSGMNAESSLRQFGMIEPMLAEELAAAGCPDDMIAALLNCQQRSPAAAAYLGHRFALENTLEKYEASITNGSMQGAAALGMELLTTSRTIQHKLIALQSTVRRFFAAKGSFSAPRMPFTRKEGSDTFEQTWGVNELATLRSSESGRAILDAPCCDANIVKAKSAILQTQTASFSIESEQAILQAELATLQANERAAYYADYPGIEALFASGAMKSSQEMIADMAGMEDLVQNFSGMDLDGADYEQVIISDDEDDDEEMTDSESACSCDGSCNGSHHKCKHNDCNGFDMNKVHAYSGKSYDVLTNPWWDDEEA